MISAIVLAAGKSSRMGAENKMLLPFKGSTMISLVIAALDLSLVEEIIVVENHETNIAQQLEYSAKVKFVINLAAEQGLTTSIQCGIKAASSSATAYLICLGDMPLLTNNDYNILINKTLENSDKVILIPKFNNKRGNPVLFSSHFKDEILRLGEKSGCKPVVVANDNFVNEVPFPDNHCHVDIDNLEDYQQFK
jgi:molybdenum cofactor cytidylyltransferase